MASICKDPGGKKRILFVDGDGKRWPIRLGKMPLADARTIKSHIESLLASKTSGRARDNETAKWVRDMPDGLAGKLAAVGLIEPRNTQTLGHLLESFVASHTGRKSGTQAAWGQVFKNLKRCYGESAPIKNIGRTEAEKFREYLIGIPLAPVTIQRQLQHSKQFFTYAVRQEWLDKNPFGGVTYASGDNRKRQYYVTPEDTQRLIEAAPNHIWRTIIALCRYGGLRCPSEVLSLPLANMDWERGAMRVIAPKTEHHSGQGVRLVPMFARLRPYLDEAWEMAKEGQTHVIPEDVYLPTSYVKGRWTSGAMRPQFLRIIQNAGLTPWPRLFHNLRASCESDLAREHPITTVCKWMGNTVAIATRHYIQVTDGDFQKAIMGTGPGRVAQNEAQSVQVLHGKAKNGNTRTPVFPDTYGAVLNSTTPDGVTL